MKARLQKIAAVAVAILFGTMVAIAFTHIALDAQAPRQHPQSEPAAVAIVERSVRASSVGAQSPYSHWIQETQAAGGPAIRTEIYTAAPNKVLMRNMVGGELIAEFGYDGVTGWSSSVMTGVVRLSGPELESMRSSVTSVMTPVVDSSVRLLTLGRRTLDGEPVDAVRLIAETGDTAEVYYATATGLLVGARMPAVAGAMPEATTILFRDYTKVGRRTVSMTMVVRMAGMESVSRTVHLSHDPIPAERFKPPAAKPDATRER